MPIFNESGIKLSDGSGLMLALDVQSSEEALHILACNHTHIDAIKLGSTLLVSPHGGYGIISRIRQTYSFPILVDSKLKDVPHVLLYTAQSIAEHGASGFTCWAGVGKKALSLLAETLAGKIDLVALTALSCIPLAAQEDTAKQNILTAVAAGCKHIQIPGNFPSLILWARKNIPDSVHILSCGIGVQGGVVGDAIRYGATYEIIGRNLLDYDSDEAMESAFGENYTVIHKAMAEKRFAAFEKG